MKSLFVSGLAFIVVLNTFNAAAATFRTQAKGHDEPSKESKMAAVNKVVTLLKKLQSDVLDEGEKEAHSYNKFSCFCKDTTSEKTSAVQKGTDIQSALTASIAELSTSRDGLDTTIQGNVQMLEATDGLIKANEAKRKGELEEYRKNEADLLGAISALHQAISALKAAASGSASLVQLRVLQSTLRSDAIRAALATAAALGQEGAAEVVTSFLEQAPSEVPMEDYKFHSGSIIETLENLLKAFKAEKDTVDADEVTASHLHDVFMQEQTDLVKRTNEELVSARKLKAQQQEEIASKSQRLSTVSATLLDDQKYLQELGLMCSDKAKTWDLRSSVRQDELSALTAAIDLIEGAVSNKTSGATIRFAQQGVSVRLAEQVARSRESMESIEAAAEAFEHSTPSFLQFSRHSSASATFLARTKPARAEDSRDAILAFFKSRALALHSALLTSLSSQLEEDRFAKVKVLIQELIERLQKAASNENTQKGWCDKSISDAEQKRDYAAKASEELNVEMAKLEAARDELAKELMTLAAEIADLQKRQGDATTLRGEEKAENGATITEAQEGKSAVTEAIDILTKFYKTASKGNVTLAQQSPSEEAPDAGFESGEAYLGAQAASRGVIGMLEVILGDFDRTISETEAAEKQAQADYEAFMLDTGKSLATKQTAETEKISQKGETEASLSTADGALKAQMEMVATSIKELLELQPACVNTGQSYEERRSNRLEEMAALKQGLCILEQYSKYGPDSVGNAC